MRRTFSAPPRILIKLQLAVQWAGMKGHRWAVILAGTAKNRALLLFAELKDPVKDKLRRFGFLVHLGAGVFFATIEAAVDGYLSRHAVDIQNSQNIV